MAENTCTCGHHIDEHPEVPTSGDDRICGCVRCPCDGYEAEHNDGHDAP